MLVRLEKAWQHYGDVLSTVKFVDDDLVIPDYFGKHFRIPVISEGIAPPSAYLKYYPFDVSGENVLDIGAYIGDTPLMWLYKGAKSVIAIEPVALHFQYLLKNVEGLPVKCLQASLAVQLPNIPSHEGSVRYGLLDEVSNYREMLDVPTVQLTELVKEYGPTVIKLNCEGCEHYVLEQLSELPGLGVKKIAVQFHEVRGYDPYESLAFLEGKLGRAIVTHKKNSIPIPGRVIKLVTVYWSL